MNFIMYIKKDALSRLEEVYGCPRELNLEQMIRNEEMNMLQASRKNNRSHDFTFFIFDETNRIAVIRKPQHPPGVYRAPSGGAEPNEDLVTAIRREALEETGLKITIEQYLLRIKVKFKCNDTVVPWVSHIVTARSAQSQLCPLDLKEIEAAKWVSWQELQGPIRAKLKSTELGLFQYRVALTDAVARLLNP